MTASTENFPLPLRGRRLALPGVLALVVLLGLPSLFLPFGRDQGFFAAAGDALLSGKALYREVWDVKPPGIFWAYAAAQALFGRGTHAAHVLDLAAVLLASGALAALGARLLGRAAGLLAAAMYGAWYFLVLDYWNLAQPEGFLWALTILAAALLTGGAGPRTLDPDPPGSGRGTRSLAAGVLLGVAFLFKTTAVLFTPAVPLVLLVTGTPRAALRGTLLAALGFLAVCAAVVARFAGEGALADFLAIYRIATPGYAAMGGSAVRGFLAGNGIFLAHHAGIAALAALGLALGLAERRTRRGTGLVLALAVLAMSGVWVQRKYYLYHWTPAFGFLSLLAAQGVVSLMGRMRGRRAAGAVAIGAALVVLASGDGMGLRWVQQARLVLAERTGRISRASFEAHFGDPRRSDFHLPTVARLADAIRRATPPGVPVYVLGFEPLIYYLADRPCPSRFYAGVHAFAAWVPPEWRDELLADLERTRPAYLLIDGENDFYWVTGRAGTAREMCREDASCTSLLARRYREETTFGPYRIFALASPSDEAAP